MFSVAWRWAVASPRVALAFVLAASLLVRLPLLTTPGQGSDLSDFGDWGWLVRDHGIEAAYDVGRANYPPIYLYVLGLVAEIGEPWRLPGPRPSGGRFPPSLVPFYPLFKAPALVADLLLGVAVFLAARRWGRPDRAIVAAAAVTLNPALIYATAWWGQVDSIHTLLMLASIAAALAARPGLAGGAWVLALLTKFQSLVVAPIVAALVLRGGVTGVWRAALGGIAVGVAVLAPVAAAGALRAVFDVYAGSADKWPVVTKNAYNLWYLVVSDREVSDLEPVLGALSYRQVGLLLLAGWSLLVVGLSLRRREPWTSWVSAAAMALGFFCLPTQMHERYLYPAPVFLAVVAWRDPRLMAILTLLSSALFLNLVLVEPWPLLRNLMPYPPVWLPAAVSASNVAALLALGAWLWRGTSRAGQSEPHGLPASA